MTPLRTNPKTWDELRPVLERISAAFHTIRRGTATFVAGAASIADPLASATTTLLVVRETAVNAGTITWTVTPGVGFALASSSGTDASKMHWVALDL